MMVLVGGEETFFAMQLRAGSRAQKRARDDNDLEAFCHGSTRFQQMKATIREIRGDQRLGLHKLLVDFLQRVQEFLVVWRLA